MRTSATIKRPSSAASTTRATTPTGTRFHDLLGRLEYLCEWFAPGYVAVSVEPGRSHEEFFAGLTELGDTVEVERILI